MFKKIYFRKRFRPTIRKEVWQICSKLPAQDPKFLCGTPSFFSELFFLMRSMPLLKHLRNRLLKVRKEFVQRTEPLSTIFLSNYSNVLVEWNFGIPYKTVSAKPERYARTFQEHLNILFVWTSTMQGPQSTGNFNSNTTFWKKLPKNVVSKI